jgi:hypothetical protein
MRVIYVYPIKKVASYVYAMKKFQTRVYVTHPKFVEVHAILDGWRVNRGVRGCVKTVFPLCAIKGLKMAEKWKNRNKSDKKKK